MSIYKVSVNQANIRNSHIYLTDIKHIFPSDVFGGSSKKKMASALLEIECDGRKIKTDIPSDKNLFRSRGWVREFFEKNQIKNGDAIRIEKLDNYHYKIYR